MLISCVNAKEWQHALQLQEGPCGMLRKTDVGPMLLELGENCIHKFGWINWCVLFEEPRTSCDPFHLTRGDRLRWIMLCFARVAATLTAWTTNFPSLRHYRFIHRLYIVLYTSTADCLFGCDPVWHVSTCATVITHALDWIVCPAWQYHISTHMHTTILQYYKIRWVDT